MLATKLEIEAALETVAKPDANVSVSLVILLEAVALLLELTDAVCTALLVTVALDEVVTTSNLVTVLDNVA